MAWKTLDQMELRGKRVLCRVDINVPVEDGKVTDATRIERIAATVQNILDKGGKPVLLAHFGRPKGERRDDMSLQPLIPALESVLGVEVVFASDCVGPAAQTVVDGLTDGQVALLENTRFHAEEEKNDEGFAKEMAKLGDIYCNDAFSAAHRAHASTEALARLLPCCAGRLMQAELEALEGALSNPERPVLAVVGGAKVSTKLDLLSNLIEKVDILVIGGGMANTFLAARGVDVGKSLCEHDMVDTALKVAEKAVETGCELLLPRDVVVAREFKAGAESEVVKIEDVPADAMILDAGPDSVAHVKEAIARANTLIWNGPLGAFEIKPFDAATNAAAAYAAELTNEGKLVSVAGGGDTVSALNKAGAAEGFSYISTAGGAFLEWMEGKTLPGVAALG
ncbi:phosphoglycerate kinase [Allosediminivita pacifica]|uniref:Phosphoglycerate kinase n=1 Tax=Allosediminivita pacifica TaxID=1267769 RepID=A0A2T6AVF8_9RHOB|nr:phosphoglycerate kinase [Allosediminivita pacifica]PTX47797.1 phosphoglycerate kinase [Allosediminivita pacifica]GGB12751.1 phosphoglycerate kinase [Allosediminivita pacifica]